VTKNLLIVSCSESKDKSSQPIPAIQRYTGPCYKVINKLRKENKFPSNLEIGIISAKYGFLKATDLIEYYDLRMSEKRAKELNREILKKLESLLEEGYFHTIFINLGKDYLPAINGFQNIISQNTKVIFAKGKIGQRLSQMKSWILSLEKLQFK